MKAIVTSIGERTTGLCKWSLERNGFEVLVINDAGTSLWEKLKWIYENTNESFVRVDADVVPNRHLTTDMFQQMAPGLEFTYDGRRILPCWVQFKCFGWFSQQVISGGVQLITEEALPTLRKHIDEARDEERPESYMFRLQQFHRPRVCVTVDDVVGIHGYAQDDVERVKEVKARRGQLANYDFELAERLSALCG